MKKVRFWRKMTNFREVFSDSGHISGCITQVGLTVSALWFSQSVYETPSDGKSLGRWSPVVFKQLLRALVRPMLYSWSVVPAILANCASDG